MAAAPSKAAAAKAYKVYKSCASFSQTAKQTGHSEQSVRRMARREQWDILPQVKEDKYSDEQRAEAIAAYVATGSMCEASRMANVPDQTIKKWTSEEWCMGLMNSLREQKAIQLDAGMTEVIDLAMIAAKDRLTNGEDSTQWDESKEAFRPRKMSGQSCATTLAIMYDKRAMLRGEGQQAAPGADALSQMTKLAEAFVAISKGAKEKPADEAIDITPE